MSNHLGTACLELDQSTDIISYEEFTPYGSTAYQAVRAGIDKNPKRYRYTGKERDEENGLSYHGARYYASWLGRWTSSDPGSIENDINTYCFVGCQPANRFDPDGRSWKDFGKGVLVGAATALVIGGAIALAPITIPAALATGLVVAGVAASGYTLVQSARERDILNRPISAEQAHYQAGTVIGGLVVAAGSGPISSGMSGAATSAQESVAAFTSSLSPLPATGSSVATAISPVSISGTAVTAGGLIESVASPVLMSASGSGGGSDPKKSGNKQEDESSSQSANVQPKDKVTRQDRLNQLAKDPNTSRADKGWIKNQAEQVAKGNRQTMKNPPGKDLQHPPKGAAAQGNDYSATKLQDRANHWRQHRYLQERSSGTKIQQPKTPSKPPLPLPD